MPYARIDSNNRIEAWFLEEQPGTVEFSNGDYVDATCINGLDDFRIENGLAVFDPKPETQHIIETGIGYEEGIRRMYEELPTTLADSDAAICELYETALAQSSTIAEQDAAICELYELIMEV